MSNQLLYELHASICQALSHPKRLQLLDLLRGGEKSGKELSQALGLKPPAVSRHMATLRPQGMVVARRAGPHVYYSLSNPKIVQACDTMRQVLMAHLAVCRINKCVCR